MDPGLKLRRPDPSEMTAHDKAELAKFPYRSLVGCLLYLSVASRPDITYAVQQLSQFLDSYSYAHWNAAIRIVRYLKGTRELKLVLGGTNPISLVGFTDSNWANCKGVSHVDFLTWGWLVSPPRMPTNFFSYPCEKY